MAEVEGQAVAGRCCYAQIGSEACGNAELKPLVQVGYGVHRSGG